MRCVIVPRPTVPPSSHNCYGSPVYLLQLRSASVQDYCLGDPILNTGAIKGGFIIVAGHSEYERKLYVTFTVALPYSNGLLQQSNSMISTHTNSLRQSQGYQPVPPTLTFMIQPEKIK